MDYDYETIEARMKSLPDDLQEAMISFDTVNKIEEIAKKYGLAIDQTGALGDVTSYVMLGLVPGKNFVPTLMKKAEIDEKKATDIAKDINTEIFDGIRESLRKIEEEKEKTNNTDLEKAGDMSVDKNRASADVVSGGKNAPQMSPQLSKAITLDAIENPPPFMEKLLTGTVGSVTETVTKQVADPGASGATPPKSATMPPAAPAEPSKPRVDPYREPIE